MSSNPSAGPNPRQRERSAINTVLRGKPRRERKQNQQGDRETADVAGAAVRMIGAVAARFAAGYEDVESLDYVRQIQAATAELEAVALLSLHDQYSNAEIGAKLGVTPQAASQKRQRALNRLVPSHPPEGK